MIATKSDAYRTGRYGRETYRGLHNYYDSYSKEDIDRIIEHGSPEQRAALSRYYFENNGVYRRIIIHYATFLSYAWVLVPHLKGNNLITDKKIAKAYNEAALFTSDLKIEKRCVDWCIDALVKGAYFGLIIGTDNGVAIQDLPYEYCRSRYKNRDEVDIVEFNVQFFDEKIAEEELRKEILQTYPKYIQKAYWAYKRDPVKNPHWIFLKASDGIYFCFYDEIPFFLSLIPELDDLKDYKDIDKKRKMQALKHIFVQEVKTDGLNLVFEPDEAQVMHQGVVSMLKDNDDVDVVTTYNDTSMLDLSTSDDDAIDLDKLLNQIYESAGVSKELFDATTDAGLDMSLKNDLAMMMIIARKFANFFTSIVNYHYANNKIVFKVVILPLSAYNQDSYYQKAKELGTLGYSYFLANSIMGVDQVDLVNFKHVENDLLGLQNILIPLQTAYTQSGKQSEVRAEDAKKAASGETTTSIDKQDVAEDTGSIEKNSENSQNSDKSVQNENSNNTSTTGTTGVSK